MKEESSSSNGETKVQKGKEEKFKTIEEDATNIIDIYTQNGNLLSISTLDSLNVKSEDVYNIDSQTRFCDSTQDMGENNRFGSSEQLSRFALNEDSKKKVQIPAFDPTANLNNPFQSYSSDALCQNPRAVYWQQRSKIIYIFCLFISFLINFPFAIAVAVMIRMDDPLSSSGNCHPHEAEILSLSCVCFILNLGVVSIYGLLVYKYREGKWIKTKNSWYLCQIFALGMTALIFSFCYLLIYFGVTDRTSNCHMHQYIIQIYEFGEVTLSIAKVTYLSVVMRLLDNMFISGAVARQRILYLLFVKGSGRQYSKKYLQRQHFLTIFVILLIDVLFEVPILVYWSVKDEGDGLDNYKSRNIAIYMLQLMYGLFVMSLFFYYSWQTRKIDKFFSDWGTNVKVACSYSLIIIVYYATSLISLLQLESRLGPVCAIILIFGFWFQVSHYITSGFTKELLFCVGFGPSKISS